MQKVLQWVERHPVFLSGLSFVVGSLPGSIGSVWALVSNEPLTQVVGVWLGGVKMPTLSAYWFTVSLGLLILGVVAYVVVTTRRRIKVIEDAVEVAASIPREEKGLLDFGAGIEEAIVDHATVLEVLNGDVRRLGQIASKSSRRIQSSESLTARKRRTERVAKKIDKTSMAMEPRIVRLENTASLLLESLVGFVELCDEAETLVLFRSNAVVLRENVPEAIAGMTSFQTTLVELQEARISWALNQALARLATRVARILGALETVLRACDDAMAVIDAKINQRSA